MRIDPSPDAFARAYEAGETQLVSTTLVGDLETPVGAYLKLARPGAPSFLLESVEGGAVRGRYSMIGLDPDLVFRVDAGKAAVARCGGPFVPVEEAPLDALRAVLAESRLTIPEHLPPMASGVFGHLGYDMVRFVEDLPTTKPDTLGLPTALMVRPTAMVVFDAVADTLTFVLRVAPEPGVSAETALERARERLDTLTARLDEPVPKGFDLDPEAMTAVPVSNTPKDDYLAMVAAAKEYIAAGDIFQVVLSQRFSAPFTLPPFALYRALRRVNPAPFLFFLDIGEAAVVGSSPEILVRAREGKVTIRPIAGTRRRGSTPAEDRALEAELLADPKERAEHLMLLDLGRNDVGRVAEIGSVTVTDRFFVERYSQVMHIVSNVEGKLSPEHDVIAALAAGFPAGTVSGAPKVRAMQIIDELERDRRSLYAGAVGYFSAAGDMDTCIVLRTAIVKDGVMHVQAGAGIVADSNPDAEQAECEAKARALFRAAEEAVRFAARAGRGQ